MKMIIHDLSQQEFESIRGKDNSDIVVSDNGTIKPCIGCFGCWIKTPGVCVLKDDYQNMGGQMAACDQVIVISKCFYGSDSPFIRNVLNRSIPYILPYFTIKNGEMHHQARYQNQIAYSAYFYGEDMTPGEMETARRLVHANAMNLHADVTNISFHRNFFEIKEKLEKIKEEPENENNND